MGDIKRQIGLSDSEIMRSALISDDGIYRYSLDRVWNPYASVLTFIMLNPSTADALVDDPTIRRCMGFAKRDGFGGIRVLNLYAFRATNPKDMFRALDPIGPLNNQQFTEFDMNSGVVAAWGANAKPDRIAQVMKLLQGAPVWHLDLTKAGQPKHPLYLPGDARYERFN